MDLQLLEWLKSHGQTFTPDLTETGVIKTFKNENGKGWYIFNKYKDSIIFMFGDWRENSKYKYVSKPDLDFSDPEYIALQEQVEAVREEKRRHTRSKALAEINKSGQNMMTPYLEAKGFTDSHPTLYQLLNPYGDMDLVVPMQDIDGEVWNTQRIEPMGTKSFMEGGKVKGLFHNLTPLHMGHTPLYIVEGLATGLSLLSLLDEPSTVIVAFSATNLQVVARALREKYPGIQITIAADNDHLKDLNFGLKAACDAANVCGGLIIYPPFSPDQPGTDWNDLIKTIGFDRAKQELVKQLNTPNSIKELVDTNYGKEIPKKKRKTKAPKASPQSDLKEETTPQLQLTETSDEPHSTIPQIRGEENSLHGSRETDAGCEVLDLEYGGPLSDLEDEDFADPSKDLSAYPKEIRPYINGILPMDLPIDKKTGKQLPPTETGVANYLVAHYKKSIRRYGEKDLFKYTGKYWKQLGTREILALKNKIRVASWGRWGSRQVDATYKTFFGLLRVMGGNPFVPNAQKVSFANCTVHVDEDRHTRVWNIRRAPHNPADFITHFIPYNLPDKKDGPLPTNPHFMGMLDNIFKDDPEKEKKILLLQEMYGACLFPVFPRLFLIYGQGGTGKSSLIKCAMRLVHPSAQCSVDPTQMSGFRMHSMAGKLVNALTEVELTRPMEDSVIKMIDDRKAITIERKNRDDITATIPAIHIFGANGIPATKDLTTNSMLRRWSFIHTASMNKSEDPDPEYAHWAFDQNPDAVVGWAFVGALRNFNSRGKYTTFESDRAAIKEWQSGRDSVQQFLEDMRTGEACNVVRGTENDRIKTSELWRKFVEWSEFSNSGKPRFGKKKFYSEIQKKGISKCEVDGHEYFKGLKIELKGATA